MYKKGSFDFKEVISSSFEPFEQIIREIESTKKPKSKSKVSTIIITGFIAVNIVILAGFMWEYYSQNDNPNQSNNQQIAGAIDTKQESIISGATFSIVSKEKPPIGYEIVKKVEPSPYFSDMDALVNGYLISDTIEGKPVTSGIEIISLEYDNKRTVEEFSQNIRQLIGEEYVILNQKITIPKNIQLTKITKPIDDKHIEYYTTVTDESYYVIKVYNQTRVYPELIEYSNFTASILQNLYLN